MAERLTAKLTTEGSGRLGEGEIDSLQSPVSGPPFPLPPSPSPIKQ